MQRLRPLPPRHLHSPGRCYQLTRAKQSWLQSQSALKTSPIRSGICYCTMQTWSSHDKANMISCARADQTSQDIIVLPLPIRSPHDVLCFADSGLHSHNQRSAYAPHNTSYQRTCIRRLTTSKGYATVCPVVPAIAPHASRASVLSSLSSLSSAYSNSASGSWPTDH